MSNNRKPRARDTRTVEVEITSTRWGSNPSSTVKVINAPMIGESTIRLDITVDLRKTGRIEIRPVRRDADDHEGVVEDAERIIGWES